MRHITNMNEIIINLFVIFAVSASAELRYSRAQQAPYEPSGWRPSGPEFRYPPLDTQPSISESYIPPARSESRAFAQVTLNTQLPQPSFRSQTPEQQSWNSERDLESSFRSQKPPEQPTWNSQTNFGPPSQGQNSWNKPQTQPDFRSKVRQQQQVNPQISNPTRTSRISGQFSDSPALNQDQSSSYLPPLTQNTPPASGPLSSQRTTPSGLDYSNADQNSYLPPSNSRYRFQNFQQSSYLTPPQEYRAIPYNEYGPPPQEYGPPPSQEYGPPNNESTTTEEPTTEGMTTTTEAEETATTELPVVVDARTESLEANALSGEERSQKLTQEGEQGTYYVYHPSGLLQRIRYTTNDDQKGMVYSAKLRYENVEPINGPIYTYDPETYVFKRIN